MFSIEYYYRQGAYCRPIGHDYETFEEAQKAILRFAGQLGRYEWRIVERRVTWQSIGVKNNQAYIREARPDPDGAKVHHVESTDPHDPAPCPEPDPNNDPDHSLDEAATDHFSHIREEER